LQPRYDSLTVAASLVVRVFFSSATGLFMGSVVLTLFRVRQGLKIPPSPLCQAGQEGVHQDYCSHG
jgi:hypothetical protein